MLADVHVALHHCAGAGASGKWVRTYLRKELSQLPGVWVYSMGYEVLRTDTGGYDGATAKVSGPG